VPRGDKQGQDGPVASIKLDLCLIDSMRDDLHSSSTLLAETGVQTDTAHRQFRIGVPHRLSAGLLVDAPRRYENAGNWVAESFLHGLALGRMHAGTSLRGRTAPISEAFDQEDVPSDPGHTLGMETAPIRLELELERVEAKAADSGNCAVSSGARLAGDCYDCRAVLLRRHRSFQEKVEFDWSAFDSNRPLVYCAVSTPVASRKPGMQLAVRPENVSFRGRRSLR
jgi:hypothetical protein